METILFVCLFVLFCFCFFVFVFFFFFLGGGRGGGGAGYRALLGFLIRCHDDVVILISTL